MLTTSEAFAPVRGNETRNQHYVSQVEQRLNAANPDSTSGKFRIYSFRITDREAYQIEIENPRGRPITSTLSMLDLFSFDVSGGDPIRKNLEGLFHKYEANVAIHTRGLLEKLAAGSTDIKTELIDLFAAKLLNFIRNPFSIQKVLNSFPGVGRYEPTDPELLAVYRRIVDGQKPHQVHICRQLDVSHETYVEWLRLIFILLMQTEDDRPNLFESMIKQLFEARDTQASAWVWNYDQDFCLLSDRGCCQPIQDGTHMAMSFNLCSTAFVDFIFTDVPSAVAGRATPEFVANALSARRRRPRATINVTVTKNDRQMLVRYNRCVVYQSRERVYSAARSATDAL